jgi:predicted  nucleic acid-binding Zn-ribbon protein
MVEARRRVAQMETTIASFEKTIRDLEGWIEAEQSRPGNHADSTLATSLTQRRDTLKRSIEELQRKLAETRPFALQTG